MKYWLFIGRWSPFHNGHKYIIDSYINTGKPVCIAVRDSKEKYSTILRKIMIEAVYKKEIEEERVKVIIIPDIEGVAVGRKLGYSVIQVPDKIKNISGTKIRAGQSNDVPPEVQQFLDEWKKYNEKI